MRAEDYLRELHEIAGDAAPGGRRFEKLKRRLCKKYGLARVPGDSEFLLNIIPRAGSGPGVAKPVRTISGVAPVSVATEPRGCPHGKCTFCPGGPGSPFGDVPQSYTGREPSIARSAAAGYDAYITVMNRLAQYVLGGHSPEKVELIVQGGTFPSHPEQYQRDFVRDCYLAMRDFGAEFYKNGALDARRFADFYELPSAPGDAGSFMRILERLRVLKSAARESLAELRDSNERERIKCVGLTIETKPDWGFAGHGRALLDLGCTRIELGVQTADDEILQKTHRGHTVADTKRSIRELRDLGYKLNFHVMPGLPGSTRESDVACFDAYFNDPEYRPDMLKIYPCLVLRGTPLYEEWKAGRFAPLSAAQAADIIVECKKRVPNYCRIMRIQRDIPTPMTEDGVERNNLRQYVSKLARERGVRCACIRCREPRGVAVPSGSIRISSDSYEASGGMEYFISAVSGEYLLGFARLRFPSAVSPPVSGSSPALLRELHVYGFSTPLGEPGETQHRGVGSLLLQTAESIARASGKDKLTVIAAAGVRGYFRKFNYRLEDPYMTKRLDR
ncbi:MAG: tRNA uridine(34) 5-carboxymethylaminomethyl modification radical SAM/GNAT enzyme Elp3 [Planctomycetes bacterium]|nr:tRNA uridine(34) 5-carboxymethylaminomethyl modification radical SAM/GNAT enzyme Elp3 [Planctomycetota bacterium]